MKECKMPFYSIIIPTYNSAETISVAVESVLNQSLKDFEIIIVDGCSSDNTTDIVKGYKDASITTLSESDEGIYDAMNKGVRRAKGNWLFFMGSDDRFYSNDVLEQIDKTTRLNQFEVVYGDVYSNQLEGRYDGEFTQEKIIKKNICHQAIFFHRDLFQSIGCFDLKYKAWADWDHNMRWLLSSEVNKIYVDCIVSEYADGGFSSQHGDPSFQGEKWLKYLLYGRQSLNIETKVSVLIRGLRKTAMSDKRNFLKLLLNIPRIFS